MNNKPIAWINEYDGLESFNPDNRQDWIPVYTQSVKEITDAEIAEVAKDFFLSEYVPYDFVRAILRKAQDK